MTVMRMKLGDDTPREVEVDVPADGDAAQLLGSGPAGSHVAQRTLHAALETVVPALSMVVKELQTVDPAVEEIAVDVGLSVGGTTGLLLVQGRAEATFHVTLSWRRPGTAGPLDAIGEVHSEGGPR
jgi:NTP-dependent ternary system trypsin peptidase co-occuring protein